MAQTPNNFSPKKRRKKIKGPKKCSLICCTQLLQKSYSTQTNGQNTKKNKNPEVKKQNTY